MVLHAQKERKKMKGEKCEPSLNNKVFPFMLIKQRNESQTAAGNTEMGVAKQGAIEPVIDDSQTHEQGLT